ncbi:MAG: DNA cytosine methyltransferase, partial [Verrucomicrobiota bacterium]
MSRRKTDFSPTAIDLFAGCGGLTEGLSHAGYKVLAAVEMNELAVETYRANHKSVHVEAKDICFVSPKKLLREIGLKRGELDLLAGCPPCQGFSSLRTLNGSRTIRDKQNDLIYQFLKFVRILRPKTIMLENVPGLMTDRRFKEFIHDIKILGYKNPVFGLFNARDYGVPQRRRRLIMMASRLGKVVVPKRTRKTRTVRDAIQHLPAAGNSGDPPPVPEPIQTAGGTEPKPA